MAPNLFTYVLVFSVGLLAATVAEIVTLEQLRPHHTKLLPKSPFQPRFSPPIGAGTASDTNGDLELLDVVLFASVDGKLHALNRTSGRMLWSMSSSASSEAVPSMLGPLVRTSHLESDPELTDDENSNQELYIIEPQSGDIYMLSSPFSPLKRLSISMAQLVEMSPFTFSSDENRQVFVGKKETSLLLVDLETGKVKATLNSECPWDPSEDLHESALESDTDDLEDSDETIPSVGKAKRMEVFIGRTGS
jgi:serine/threonine-protein kinase/endoribonuclease IRE1